jgi:hypothetical protein
MVSYRKEKEIENNKDGKIKDSSAWYYFKWYYFKRK